MSDYFACISHHSLRPALPKLFTFVQCVTAASVYCTTCIYLC